MKQIEDGIFECKETMPCRPNDILIEKYLLRSTLDRAEPEEAAARILLFSQEKDKWVGVSWDKLLKKIDEEYKLSNSQNELRRQYWKKKGDFLRKAKIHSVIDRCTFGLYGSFVKKPQLDLEPLPELNIPFSLIFGYGSPEPVVIGIFELAQKKLITVINIIEDDKNTEIFFPTAELIHIIWQKQLADKVKS